jgi:hypothetical protein
MTTGTNGVPDRVLTRLLELLRREPILLYGIGSVLVLAVLLVGVGAVADQVPLIVAAAVLLLLAALAAGTYVLVRKPTAPPRVDVSGRNIKAARDSAIVREEGAAQPSGVRVTATGDVVASDSSAIVDVGSRRRPARRRIR